MPSIREVLAGRGLEVASEGAVATTPGLARMLTVGTLDRYGELLESRSFRKTLQRLAGIVGGSIELDAVQKMCGAKTSEYIDFMADAGLLTRDGQRVAATTDLKHYGHHLEWYVAMLCQQEFPAATSWNVKVRDLLSGGDFDVLLNIDRTLVHAELKSSRASATTDMQLRHFLQRRVDLSPDLAILMIDTDDDISDLVSRVNRIIVNVFRTMPTIPPDYQPEQPLIGPVSSVPGVHWGLRNLYFANSHPSFRTQLRRCLRFYHEFASHQMYLGGDPPNFLSAGLSMGGVV
jgi:hypothetical protein